MNDMTIWKYPLYPFTTPEMQIPSGAQLLHVAVQDGDAMLWALVDKRQPLTTRKVYVCGTGHPIPSGSRYVGTIQQGAFVWHIFDGGEA